MLQVQMSAAHEGKLMKESSLQTQSGISLPSQQRTCMQCMAREQGWKEANPLNMGSLHGQASMHVESLLLQRCQFGKWVWPIQCASQSKFASSTTVNKLYSCRYNPWYTGTLFHSQMYM